MYRISDAGMFSVGDVDLSRPIDVLFYGGKNPHREQVKRIIERKLVEEHGLRVVFAMDYNLFGIAREVAIENAKVCLIYVFDSIILRLFL